MEKFKISKFVSIIALILIVAGITSCERKAPDDPVAPSLQIEYGDGEPSGQVSIAVPAEGRSFTVTIIASYDWKIKENFAGDIVVSPKTAPRGTTNVTIDVGTSPQVREVAIEFDLIEFASPIAQLMIIQAAPTPALGEVLYFEDAGSGPEATAAAEGNPAVAVYSAWSRSSPAGLDQSGVVYSGAASVRNTGIDSFLEGFSGHPNIFMNSESGIRREFTIGAIATGDNSELIFKAAGIASVYPDYVPMTPGMVEFWAGYDGKQWAKLDVAIDESKNYSWVSAEFAVEEGTQKIYIKIVTLDNSVRWDDLTLATGGNGTLIDIPEPRERYFSITPSGSLDIGAEGGSVRFDISSNVEWSARVVEQSTSAIGEGVGATFQSWRMAEQGTAKQSTGTRVHSIDAIMNGSNVGELSGTDIRGCFNFATEGILLRFACFPPSRLGHSSKLDGSRLGVGSGSGRGIFSRGEGGVGVSTVSETREKSTGSESERPRAANSKQPLNIDPASGNGDGTVTVSVGANTDSARARNFVVEFSTLDENVPENMRNRQFTIIQRASERRNFSVTAVGGLDVGAESVSVEFAVEADVDWNVVAVDSTDSSFHIDPEKGSGNDRVTLFFGRNVSENSGRRFTIEFSTDDVRVPEVDRRHRFTVEQSAAEETKYFLVTPLAELDVAYNITSVQFAVSSNVEWSATPASVSVPVYISPDGGKGSGDGTVTVFFGENAGVGSERHFTIEFSTADEGVPTQERKVVFTVDQSAHPAPVVWERVSSVEDVVAGEYVIVFRHSSDSRYYALPTAAKASNPVAVEVLIGQDGNLAGMTSGAIDDTIIWSLGGNNTDGFTVGSANLSAQTFLESKDDSQGIKIVVTTTSSHKWSLGEDIENGMLMRNRSISATRNLALFISASGEPTWRYYTLGTYYKGQLMLFKATE